MAGPPDPLTTEWVPIWNPVGTGPTGPQGTPGEKWFAGAGAPAGALAGSIVGDWYLDTVTADVYEKTGASAWTLRGNIKGTPGEKWFSGAGAPAGATGIVGDWYLDTATGDVYEKTGASAWTLRANIKGPQGIQGVQGIQGATGATGAQGPPGDEVFVGPADPGATFDMWYDTDEPALPAGPAHASTHAPGGSDPLVGAAWLAVDNTFTGLNDFTKQITIRATTPGFNLVETDAVAGSKNWQCAAESQSFAIIPLDDTWSQLNAGLRVGRTGLVTALNMTLNGAYPQIRLDNAFPIMHFNDTSAAVDGKLLRIWASATNLYFQMMNDAGSAVQTSPLVLLRNGSIQVGGGISERGRSAPMGEWVAWTPTITNASGGAISSGGTVLCAYTLIGRTLFYTIYADTLNVSVATASIRITPPPGLNPTNNGAQFWVMNRLYSGGYVQGVVFPNPAGWFEVQRFDTAAIAAGITHIYSATGFYYF